MIAPQSNPSATPAASPIRLSQPPRVVNSSPWPHRVAMAVALTTFPLIWVGGLVTTQDAGMAVPDWPGTYGYNLFAYPLSAWLFGPFDLFIEHGHRLLASLVGLMAIVLCVVSWRHEGRRWLRLASWLLLAAIISQGILGGIRVLFDARTMAMIHGVSGPLVFAFAAAMAEWTSPRWRESVEPEPRLRWLLRWSWWLTGATVLQLLVGAQLRHVLPSTSGLHFQSLVHLHLTMVPVLIGLALIVGWGGRSRPGVELAELQRLRWGLCLLFAMQILLGVGTWICNYALPWSHLHPWLAGYTIANKGYWESWITTGHQATGSLIILTSLLLTMRIWRRRWGWSEPANSMAAPGSTRSAEA